MITGITCLFAHGGVPLAAARHRWTAERPGTVTRDNQSIFFEVPQDISGGELVLNLPATFKVSYDNGATANLPNRQQGPLRTKLTLSHK